jgi:ABC-type transport system substrate-binding protein/ABC-type transporter Mla subunit MlaD
VVFLVFLLLASGPPPTRARIVAAGLVAASIVAGFAQLASAKARRAREATRDVLVRAAAGDLTVARRELRAAGGVELAGALHGLLVGTERILASIVRLSNAISGVARDLSAGGRDLARAVEDQTVRGEETAASIERTDVAIGSLHQSMETLASAAENANASLHEMSASITQVSQGAAGLRGFVDETAGALGRMLESLRDVAAAVENLARLAEETAGATMSIREAVLETDHQSRTAARLAERVADAARAGKAAVTGTASGMTEIRDTVASASEAAAALGERSVRIGEIVRVIEEIAGETNILALNASIIAAQAGGESGKAFSVLADDIRDLSERTAVSTEEVRGLVSAVQKGVSDVRSFLADARERTEDGVDLAHVADGTLDDIQRLAVQAKTTSDTIAAATAKEAVDVGRVSEASAHVSEEVDRIFRATQGQLETARGVGERAERVRELTEQLSRAMQEQAGGSRALLGSMEGVTRTVGDIARATTTLAEGSAAVVRSVEGIRVATSQSAHASTSMNQTALALEQEALMLRARASAFRFPPPEPGGRIRAALRYLSEEDFDPAFSWTVPQAILVKTWGEGLVRFGDGTRIVPELAERWQVDPTGTVYTFSLRRGVRFHDGTPLTSADLRTTFLRYLSPGLGAPLAALFDGIEGAGEYRQGRRSDLPGLETPDSTTVRFRLERPLPFFLQLLTLPDVTTIPPALLDRERARLRPFGSGAFAPREIEFGRQARFDRFEGHWDRSRIALDGIDLDLTEDSEAGVFERFMRGDLDITWDVPYPEAARLSEDPEWRPYLDSTVQLHTSFVVLRCDKAPLTDVRVRRALNHAVDRGRLNERLFAGLTIPAASILPPHLVGHDPGLRGYRYDPERSRTLLAEAGVAPGTRLTSWVTPKDAADPLNMTAAIAADLRKVGLEIDVEVVPGEEMTARRKRGESAHLRVLRWFADYPDPDTFFSSLFYSKTDDVAEFGYRNDAVDRMVESGARVTDGQVREQLYRDLNRLVQSEAPGIFLFHNRGFVLHKPGLRGARAFLLPPPARWTELSFEP